MSHKIAKVIAYWPYSLYEHRITKIFFVYKQTNDQTTPQRLPLLKKLHKSHLLYILLHLILLHCNVLVICNILQITLTVIRPA